MITLVDTHLLLWAAYQPERLSDAAVSWLDDTAHRVLFSAASTWEVSIKASLGRADFDVDPRMLRRGLLDNGYEELPITAAHTLGTMELPSLHADPFDRMLIAQARHEGAVLLTADRPLAQYGSPVRVV